MYIYAIIDSINHQAKSLLKSKITFFTLKFETWCIKSLHLLRVKQSSGSRCHKVMANLCINWLLNLQRTCNALYLLLKSWLLNLQFTSGLYCIPDLKNWRICPEVCFLPIWFGLPPNTLELRISFYHQNVMNFYTKWNSGDLGVP